VSVLANDRLEWVQGWGMAIGAAGYVYRPSTVAQARAVMGEAREQDVPVTLRGAGCSYGDAALRAEAAIMDLGRMRRILSWDPQSGIVEVEPGVSLQQLWRYCLGDGWWPPVVTGTMAPTIGGALAMNVHGKNCWPRGTLGDHCLELDMLQTDGTLLTLSPTRQPELFAAVIGSFGQLGVITRARLQLKRVASGLLEVKAVAASNLGQLMRLLDDAKDRWEYAVAWIDAFARGRHLGRGLLHFARHLEQGEDPAPAQSLSALQQDLPDVLFGAIPTSIMWRFLKPFTNRPGMRWINRSKYLLGSTIGDGDLYRQSLAGFSFLLDYIPGWKNSYAPGGLIQHQSFVPAAAAEQVFATQLELCHHLHQPSFLAVLKRHRSDTFLLSHGLDGYSLALDFPVSPRRRPAVWALVRRLAEPVVEAGGKFYPAKDAALSRELYQATMANGELAKLAELKQQLDPSHLLTSSLAERLVWSRQG